jgi:minor histocompatibility antigen H13
MVNQIHSKKKRINFSLLAAIFPFIASGFLFGIYLIISFVSKEYITFVLNIYFFLIGVIALYRAIRPLLSQIHHPFCQRQFYLKLAENDLIHLDTSFNLLDIAGLIFCILIGIWYLLTRHWIANNIFGIAFSINAIEILHLNK